MFHHRRCRRTASHGRIWKASTDGETKDIEHEESVEWIQRRTRLFEECDAEAISMRRPSSLIHTSACEAEIHIDESISENRSAPPDFRIEGSFGRRSCKITRGATGEVVAKISRKTVNATLLLSNDVFTLMVQPGIEPEIGFKWPISYTFGHSLIYSLSHRKLSKKKKIRHAKEASSWATLFSSTITKWQEPPPTSRNKLAISLDSASFSAKRKSAAKLWTIRKESLSSTSRLCPFDHLMQQKEALHP
ncbi:protein LURP-one-related 5-like [Forsythia ovata]|uniref:Protein LURP-one-related 5-like n=1 Tax=Forsythia ovata TaxID=205694 RepID=A0ABD1TAL4_9LAMI